jgi:hypothetical protein
MRASARVAAAVVVAGIVLGCAGCGQPAARPGAATCWQAAVRAIQRHVIVRSVPRSCAGLSGAELSVVVAWAVRAAGGPQAKAAQRRVAATDGRYLARLVRGGPAAAAGSGSTGSGSTASGGTASGGTASGGTAGPGGPEGPPGGQDAGLGLAALGSWAVTAAVGGYLFLGRYRAAGRARRTPAIAAGHASVALAGLVLCAIAAVAHGSAALAWLTTALVIGTAGLGMAVLLTAGPEHAPRPGPGPRRVLAIASHVALAVLTMLLVLLAATGRS